MQRRAPGLQYDKENFVIVDEETLGADWNAPEPLGGTDFCWDTSAHRRAKNCRISDDALTISRQLGPFPSNSSPNWTTARMTPVLSTGIHQVQIRFACLHPGSAGFNFAFVGLLAARDFDKPSDTESLFSFGIAISQRDGEPRYNGGHPPHVSHFGTFHEMDVVTMTIDMDAGKLRYAQNDKEPSCTMDLEPNEQYVPAVSFWQGGHCCQIRGAALPAKSAAKLS
eukprot:m.487003 g.487003  ORF g.487003 m.487003 type:complete len:225 (-) comp24726_c0_seq1:136-810(-)